MQDLMSTTHHGFFAGPEMPTLLRQDHAHTSTLIQQSPEGPIAVTEVAPALAQTPLFMEQFEPTMEHVARLSHPAILPVLDFGIRDGRAYIVSPYVTRGSLAGEIHMAGPLSPDRTLNIIGQLADVLDYIHNQEMIHCGLTAEVVLRGIEGSVLLDGLGIADLIFQAVGATQQLLPYAAPELLIKAPYTARVDIYALGILTFQMLTGHLPFTGTTTTQYMHAHLRRPLPALGAGMPEQVHLILKQATGKLAHSRYWSARELTHDLAQAAGLQTSSHMSRPDRTLSQILTRYRSLRSGPSKQRGNLKVSQMYTEALLRERQDPVEARHMYHQILELWPRMAQGDVLDRLMNLERQMLREQGSAIRSQAERALNRGDWAILLRASQQLIEVNSIDTEADQMQRLAATMLAAEEHYRAAWLAEKVGDTPAAIQLVRELFATVPNFSDSEGLTIIQPHRAPFVGPAGMTKAHESNILALEFSPDGRMLASGSTDKRTRIGWLPDLEVSASLDEFHSWVCTLAFSPDGEYLFTGLWDGEIRLWRLPDAEYQGMIAGLVNQMQGMVFAHHRPDHIAVAAGSFLTVWRIPSGERLATVKETDLRSISSLAYSPVSPWLICGMTHGSLRIRDASRPEYPILDEIQVHHSAVHGLANLVGGTRVASISHYDTARVTDITQGEVLFELHGHEDAILSIASSPTEPLIVTGGMDSTVRLWDAERGLPLVVLTGHKRAVSRVAISPDSRMIASADTGGVIRLWHIG